MGEPFKLKIDRNKWARGGILPGLLLNGMGSQCCVGLYLSALGVPDEALRGRGCADDVEVQKVLPDQAMWLNFGELSRSDDAQHLYSVNDCTLGHAINGEEHALVIESEEQRERLIAETFARNGVEVEFV